MYWKKRNKASFLANSERQIRTTIIGVVGTNRGVGVTHVCIMLAEYLALDKGAFVAIVACNNHGDFNRMEENRYVKGTLPYLCHQVHYFTVVDVKNLEAILKDNYGYLILDFGVQLKGKEEALRLCHKKILLGADSWWKKGIMDEKQSYFLARDFQCLFNFSEYGIPYAPLEKSPNRKVRKILDEITNL